MSTKYLAKTGKIAAHNGNPVGDQRMAGKARMAVTDDVGVGAALLFVAR